MDCKQVQGLVERYLDKELALSELRSIEQHLGQCHDCSRLRDNLMTISISITNQGRYRAPSALKNQVRKNLKEITGENESTSGLLPWLGFSGGVATVASVLTWAILSFSVVSSGTTKLTDDIINAHVRSLMVDHVIDIRSSDSHSVKPWFNGKLNFAPVVHDFSSHGYELVGGRLDYVQQRTVSAIVYHRREHVINLFMWPVKANENIATESLSRNGYNIMSWYSDGLSYWLVSDLNKQELGALAGLLGSEKSRL